MIRKLICAGLLLGFGCMAGTGSIAANAELELPPLGVDGEQRLGKFIWGDLVTDDVPAARKFYAQLFGWTFRDVGAYTIASNDERPLCGMFQRPRPKDKPGQPRWIGYISVASVQQAQRTVTGAGGKILAPPKMLPKRGEQAVFADSEGAVFGVIESSSGDPEDFLPDPGDWIWIQLFSRDARRAGEFYRAVGGYEVVANDTSSRTNSFLLTSKGYARAAVMTIPPKHAQVKPAWLPFVRVKSVSESVTQAIQLGGKVLVESKPELLENKVAVIADPTGAAIGILEWNADLAMEGKTQ